jgi:hypothetical protein
MACHYSNFCALCEPILRRGATVEGGEEKTVERSDELTTISTVAPRLDNHSPPQPALKRRPKVKPSLRDEETPPLERKSFG